MTEVEFLALSRALENFLYVMTTSIKEVTQEPVRIGITIVAGRCGGYITEEKNLESSIHDIEKLLLVLRAAQEPETNPPALH